MLGWTYQPCVEPRAGCQLADDVDVVAATTPALRWQVLVDGAFADRPGRGRASTPTTAER